MKSNGILFAALISNFAFIRSYASREPENLIGLKAEMKAIMNHGFVTHGLDFPGAFFICPEQIIPWMEDQGFSTLDLVGCEGITAGHEDKVNLLGIMTGSFGRI